MPDPSEIHFPTTSPLLATHLPKMAGPTISKSTKTSLKATHTPKTAGLTILTTHMATHPPKMAGLTIPKSTTTSSKDNHPPKTASTPKEISAPGVLKHSPTPLPSSFHIIPTTTLNKLVGLCSGSESQKRLDIMEEKAKIDEMSASTKVFYGLTESESTEQWADRIAGSAKCEVFDPETGITWRYRMSEQEAKAKGFIREKRVPIEGYSRSTNKPKEVVTEVSKTRQEVLEEEMFYEKFLRFPTSDQFFRAYEEHRELGHTKDSFDYETHVRAHWHLDPADIELAAANAALEAEAAINAEAGINVQAPFKAVAALGTKAAPEAGVGVDAETAVNPTESKDPDAMLNREDTIAKKLNNTKAAHNTKAAFNANAALDTKAAFANRFEHMLSSEFDALDKTKVAAITRALDRINPPPSNPDAAEKAARNDMIGAFAKLEMKCDRTKDELAKEAAQAKKDIAAEKKARAHKKRVESIRKFQAMRKAEEDHQSAVRESSRKGKAEETKENEGGVESPDSGGPGSWVFKGEN